MTRRQAFGFAGVGLMFLGTIVPFAQVNSVSHSLAQGEHSVLFFVIAAVAALFIALRWNLLAVIAALLGGIAFLAKALELWDLKSGNQDLEFGAYLMGLGVIIVVISAWAGGLLPRRVRAHSDSHAAESN